VVGWWRDRSGSAAQVGLALLLLGVASACSVGDGQGEIGGHAVAGDFCALDDPSYQLHPSFFTAEVTENQLNLRVQRGSALEQWADGLMIHVRDVNEIKRQRLGLPIPLQGQWTDPVQIVFYLNETCEAGFPNEHRRRAVLMQAVGGSIRFDAVYAPDIDPGATGIEAELLDVQFVDTSTPDLRRATLNGWFSFFYQRGAPAQRFP
jgi:hypothetical protein